MFQLATATPTPTGLVLSEGSRSFCTGHKRMNKQNLLKMFLGTIIFSKADSVAVATFDNRPDPISPFFKSFQQIQKPLALNGSEDFIAK